MSPNRLKLSLCILPVILSACGTDEPSDATCTLLDGAAVWFGDNRAKLNDFITANGSCAGDFDPSSPPVAVFDWDNTVIKNDIGDGTTFYMLQHSLIKKPATWAATSKHLTPEALASLDLHCGSLSDPLPTASEPGCATAILCVYYEGAVWNGTAVTGGVGAHCDGAAAWSLDSASGASSATMEPAYAWTVSLQAGYTPAEIGTMASTAFAERVAAAEGSTVTVGYINDVHGYNRIYEQIGDLIGSLSASGFDVWVSTASAEPAVAAIAPQAGVASDHVIGVRAALDGNGKTTMDFEGCGGFADGNQDIINYKQGKRCWLNKVIFGLSDASAQMSSPVPIDFAAGDSDTDVYFVKDAAGLRLAVNRQKKELMCNAYANTDGKWLVNPMFIEPKGQFSKGAGPNGASYYSCEAYGLSDQLDATYCSNSTYDSASCSAPLQ